MTIELLDSMRTMVGASGVDAGAKRQLDAQFREMKGPAGLTDGVIESLRLRGAGAARLSRVAAAALPAALRPRPCGRACRSN